MGFWLIGEAEQAWAPARLAGVIRVLGSDAGASNRASTAPRVSCRSCKNPAETPVELRGFEPLTPCLQSAGRVVGVVRWRSLSRCSVGSSPAPSASERRGWLPGWLPDTIRSPDRRQSSEQRSHQHSEVRVAQHPRRWNWGWYSSNQLDDARSSHTQRRRPMVDGASNRYLSCVEGMVPGVAEDSNNNSRDWGTLIFQVLIGVALTGAGVIITVSKPDDAEGLVWQVVVGSVMTALGGAFLSWIASLQAASSTALSGARREIFAVLIPINKSIAQKSAQVVETINRAFQGDTTPHTSLEIIYQMARTIQADAVEIAGLTGQKYETTSTVETISLMDELAQELSSAQPDVREKFEELRARFESAVGEIQGVAPPAPAMRRRELIACPETSCGLPVPVNIRTNHDSTDAACLSCFSSLEVSYPELVATKRSDLDPLEPGEIVGRNGSRPIMRCHVGNHDISAQIHTGNKYYSLCRTHDSIEVLPQEEFAAWRAAND